MKLPAIKRSEEWLQTINYIGALYDLHGCTEGILTFYKNNIKIAGLSSGKIKEKHQSILNALFMQSRTTFTIML